MMSFSTWDITLAIAVCLQATVLAYLHHPNWKALLVTLPIPFSLAALSVGRPVDATNVTGTVVLLLYTHAVRLLSRRMPLIPAIALSAAGYCLVGAGLAKILPADDLVFWLACAAVITLGLICYRLQPPRVEPGHRTSLPVWVKAPLILVVIAGLVLIKKHLGGFMTMFPMVGVIAAYESRHSLWTLSRQIPVVMFTTVPMMAVTRIAQLWWHLELWQALLWGWVVFVILLLPLNRETWRTPVLPPDQGGDMRKR